MRFSTSVLLAFLATITLCQAQAPTTQPRFQDSLSKTVVRITSTADGITGPLNATGFLVGIPDTRLPPNGVFTYLVTNRHVAQAILPGADGKPTRHRILTMEATVNLKEAVNGSRLHTIFLPPADEAWFFPSDDAIDLAVIPIPLDNVYDVIELTPANFLPDKWASLGIGVGDKLLTLGYFLHYAGTHQFQPIIREGSLR